MNVDTALRSVIYVIRNIFTNHFVYDDNTVCIYVRFYVYDERKSKGKIKRHEKYFHFVMLIHKYNKYFYNTEKIRQNGTGKRKLFAIYVQ